MSANTSIEWTDSTLNWWEGCTKVGPGCDHCYAEARNARFGGGQTINWGPGAPRRITSEHNRNNLRRWNKREFVQCASCAWRGEKRDFKRADDAGFDHSMCPNCSGVDYIAARRRVFCSSLADVFDNEAPQEWRDAMFVEMEACPELDFLVLTKRIGNARKMVPAHWLRGKWPANVWIGATIVNQAEADRDIPKLLAVPARVRFLSMEPLLGPVDLSPWLDIYQFDEASRWSRRNVGRTARLDWVIVGGESGPGARPMHPDWARSLRDQCAAAGVPFLFKQHGEWAPGSGDFGRSRFRTAAVALDGRVAEGGYDASIYPKGATSADHWSMVHLAGRKAAGRTLDGTTHDGFPEVTCSIR